MATLWRLGGSDISPSKLTGALGGFGNLYGVSVERDNAGDLIVSLFSEAQDGQGALESAKSALRLATSPAAVTIKMEWGGPVVPEPDPARPETFPRIPSLASLAKRSRSDLFQRAADGVWFDVEAVVENITKSVDFDRLISDLAMTMRAMKRFDRPKVAPGRNDRTVALNFGIAAAGESEANERSSTAVEAALSASGPVEMEARIRIVSVTQRD